MDVLWIFFESSLYVTGITCEIKLGTSKDKKDINKRNIKVQHNIGFWEKNVKIMKSQYTLHIPESERNTAYACE